MFAHTIEALKLHTLVQERQVRVLIHGDSLCKGTVPLEDGHYSFQAPAFTKRALEQADIADMVEVTNHARFGATTEKGLAMLKKDAEKGLVDTSDLVLIAFGGNDCDNDWDIVAANPDIEHPAKVVMETYRINMAQMARLVKDAGSTPVFMTMPPIDARRWMSFVTRNGADENAIIHWLGDLHEMYRFHEWYNNAIVHLAYELDVALVDIRRNFLPSRRYLEEYLSGDGIHLTSAGYALLFGELAQSLAKYLL